MLLLLAKWPGSLHLLIMHFPLCGNAANFSGVTRWAGLWGHRVSVQRDAIPHGCGIHPHSAFSTSRDELVFLARSQQVLPHPFLRPVPRPSFPREPGASYLQRLWFEQACKHTLECHWCQWDFSTLLNICFRGLMKCGLDAVAVCQMCNWKPCKSPWCCHIYKLVSTRSLLGHVQYVLYSEGRHFRETWCEIPDSGVNVARSLLETSSFAEKKDF